jgi:hypothetical protein
MLNNIKLVVRSIIGEPIDGYVRVSVENTLFNAVRGVRPLLPYRAQADQGGNGVRIFSFDNGAELHARYNKELRKTMFFMLPEDAQKNLLTISQERANQPKLPYNSNKWDASIVASI